MTRSKQPNLAFQNIYFRKEEVHDKRFSCVRAREGTCPGDDIRCTISPPLHLADCDRLIIQFSSFYVGQKLPLRLRPPRRVNEFQTVIQHAFQRINPAMNHPLKFLFAKVKNRALFFCLSKGEDNSKQKQGGGDEILFHSS